MISQEAKQEIYNGREAVIEIEGFGSVRVSVFRVRPFERIYAPKIVVCIDGVAYWTGASFSACRGRVFAAKQAEGIVDDIARRWRQRPNWVDAKEFAESQFERV